MNSVMSHPSERQVAVSATTIDPATAAEICQVSEADVADVEKAVRAAWAAFERGPWRRRRHQSEDVCSTVSPTLYTEVKTVTSKL